MNTNSPMLLVTADNVSDYSTNNLENYRLNLAGDADECRRLIANSGNLDTASLELRLSYYEKELSTIAWEFARRRSL